MNGTVTASPSQYFRQLRDSAPPRWRNEFFDHVTARAVPARSLRRAAGL